MTDRALEQLLESAVPFALRLRRPFRGVTVREGMLLRGPSGWGEFAPFDDYDDAGAARWLGAAIEAAYGSWPAPRREAIAVNAIIPACSADDATVLARDAVTLRGCTTIKVKVGGALAEDEARVASIRDVLSTLLGPGRGMIRLDANGAWTLPQAVTALRRLAAYGIEYVEQPVAGFDELRALRTQCPVPIALDEGLRRSADPAAIAADAELLRSVADVVILKTAPLGGVAAGLELAERIGLPVVVSGALDSSVGLAAPLALAAALDLTVACGLGTGALLVDDLADPPLLPVDGQITVQRPVPDFDALLAARDRVGEERATWWLARLARAWSAGAAAWAPVVTAHEA